MYILAAILEKMTATMIKYQICVFIIVFFIILGQENVLSFFVILGFENVYLDTKIIFPSDLETEIL